jgi:parallel beta-helix repeat protein
LKGKAVRTIIIVILLTLNVFWLFFNTSAALPVTRRVPEDYLTIQAAINAASSGDTILVAAGAYPEYVCVNKSVTLKGTNRQSIITGGPGSATRVVDVKISNVEISGLTVQGPALSYKGIYVEPPLEQYFTNINITDNTVIGCNDGIFYSRSSKCFVTNNTLQGNTYGIRLYDSNHNIVAENFINASGYYGINFYARSHSNNITENTVMKGKYGVLLEYASNTTMYLNTIKSNTEYAIRLSYTDYSLIKGNTLENNKYGVYIWNCSQNQFYYNNFIDNTIQAEKYGALLTANTWDTNILPGAKGNYWSDYSGVDDGTGVGRWDEPRIAVDGIGDTRIPHSQVSGVSWFGLDWYPLMYPWTPVPSTYPVAIFTWSPLEPIRYQPVTFNASKSYCVEGIIISYEWSFGDGNITTVTNPIVFHTFTNLGNYTVTLTVTDNHLLTNSTSHIVRVLSYKLKIDVYTQQPEPYSGRGPNQPSDAFEPQNLVQLYAEVTYNYEPVELKMVVFQVFYPNGTQFYIWSSNTNASGIARAAPIRLGATNATFGIYAVLAQVSVSQETVNDTLTFLCGWVIEIVDVKTLDQYGASKNVFSQGETAYFSIDIKNIAFTSRNVTVTVSLHDEKNQLIGATSISLNVPPGIHSYNMVFGVSIPHWAFVGSAKAYVNAFTKPIYEGGVPYCPEHSADFQIVI